MTKLIQILGALLGTIGGLILGLLLIYAIQKYCYAHEVEFRAGFITLWAPVQSKESEGGQGEPRERPKEHGGIVQ